MDKLDSLSESGGPGQPSVACQEDRVQRLRQRDIDCVVSRQVFPESPHAIELRFVGVPLDIQRAKILERSPGGTGVKFAFLHISSQCLGHLDIDEMGSMEPEGGVGYAGSNRSSELCAEEQFKDSGGIEDNHLESRAARITAAALGRMPRTGLAASRSRISWRVGRSSALRISRST